MQWNSFTLSKENKENTFIKLIVHQASYAVEISYTFLKEYSKCINFLSYCQSTIHATEFIYTLPRESKKCLNL